MKRLLLSAAAAAAIFVSGQSAADSSILSLSGDSSRMFYSASASESDFSGSHLSPDEIAETGRISSRFGYGTAVQILDSRISLEAQWKSRLTNYSSGESSYEVRDIAGGIDIENFGRVTFGEQEGALSEITDFTSPETASGFGTGLVSSGSMGCMFRMDRELSHNVTGSFHYKPRYCGLASSGDGYMSSGAALSLRNSSFLRTGIGYSSVSSPDRGEHRTLSAMGFSLEGGFLNLAAVATHGSGILSRTSDFNSLESAIRYKMRRIGGMMVELLWGVRKSDHEKCDRHVYSTGIEYRISDDVKISGGWRKTVYEQDNESTEQAELDFRILF